MAKTFWSVTYRTCGSDFTRTAWFDSKTAADEFAAHDYRDDPVRHTFIAAPKASTRPNSWSTRPTAPQCSEEFTL